MDEDKQDIDNRKKIVELKEYLYMVWNSKMSLHSETAVN